MHVRMTLEPAVVLGFVGIKVIEDDVDGGVGMGGDDIIHEVEELDAPPALLVRGRHLAGGYFEGGEQRRGTVALVIVAMSDQRSTVRKLQVSLRPLQRLDRGLFVDADDDSVLGWRHVKPDHVGSLGDELGIVALAPGFAPGKVDLSRTQEAPDMLDIDITQCGSQQRPGPAGIAFGRHLIQQRQDAFVRLRRILRRRTNASCRCWIKCRPKAMPAGPGRCWLPHWVMSMSSISGASCVRERSTLPGANPGARATIPSSSPRLPTWSGFTWRHPRTLSSSASTKSPRYRRWSGRRDT